MLTPSIDYRRTDIVVPDKLPEGLDAQVLKAGGFLKRLTNRRATLDELAKRVQAEREQLRGVSDARLRRVLKDCRDNVRRGGRDSERYFSESLAPVAEAARRRLQLDAYHVQIMGAIGINRGMLVEMATGEGKTLTIALAAVAPGWRATPCHVITANDYLARRDAELLKDFYEFCGVSVGYVTAEMDPRARQEAYAKDVVYTTSKEIVADFLRDRLMMGPMQDATRRLINNLLQNRFRPDKRLMMRGLHTAIVDEADNLLIDEAVTPLIISKPQRNEAMSEAIRVADALAQELKRGVHYHVDSRYKQVDLLKEAAPIIEESAQRLSNYYRGSSWMRELVVQALTAREFFHLGKQYVIREDKVVIVDEFTGRLMHGRSWKQGLHQAVEAKEGIPVTDPTESIARLSFQRFFRFFRHLSGVTGTAREAATEFWYIYRMPFVRIPTNRPCVRKQLPDKVFSDAGSKWDAIADEVAEIHATGRPVLVGTRSVHDSEQLSELLNHQGLAHSLLNAVRGEEEAAIISLAGRRGKITISTNMAGRGTDIKLEAGVAELGGLHVIAAERHEAGRIDRQLFGRAARQGDPGSARTFVSLDDELLQRFSIAPLRKAVSAYCRARLPGRRALVRSAILRAQRKAEATAYKARRGVAKQDAWLDESFSRKSTEIGV